MTQDNQNDNKTPTAKALPSSSGSTHILFSVRWSLSGIAAVKPVSAYATRKLANSAAKDKNARSTTCEYVVKTVKFFK